MNTQWRNGWHGAVPAMIGACAVVCPGLNLTSRDWRSYPAPFAIMQQSCHSKLA